MPGSRAGSSTVLWWVLCVSLDDVLFTFAAQILPAGEGIQSWAGGECDPLQFKQWQLVFGRGDEQYQQMDRRAESAYWLAIIWFKEKRFGGGCGGAPVRAKSTSSLLAPCQLHQSGFPESFTWKFLVIASFTLPDGKHAWVFVGVTFSFSQPQLTPL